MSVIYNGTTVTAINYNGTSITSAYYNNVLVFSGVTPPPTGMYYFFENKTSHKGFVDNNCSYNWNYDSSKFNNFGKYVTPQLGVGDVVPNTSILNDQTIEITINAKFSLISGQRLYVKGALGEWDDEGGKSWLIGNGYYVCDICFYNGSTYESTTASSNLTRWSHPTTAVGFTIPFNTTSFKFKMHPKSIAATAGTNHAYLMQIYDIYYIQS